MPEFYFDNECYHYSLIRQSRKSLKIAITAPYELSLKIPQQLTLDELKDFLRQNQNWIQQKNLKLTAAEKQNPPLKLCDGCLLPFMGKEYKLQVTESFCKPRIKIQADILAVNVYTLSPVPLTIMLQNWYINQAKSYLISQTDYWSGQIGTTINTIRIKEQKTRWGSCSALGNINYNWRIIMAPPATIDYLIIHEVAHRQQLNHSKQFWQLVAKHCPAYELHKEWLKNNAQRLFNILKME